MMRSWARRSCVAFAALLLLALALPVRAEIGSFRTSGSCTHLSAALSVDAAAAASLLPEQFVVLESVPGTATLALVTQDCETSVDGGPLARSITAVVFVVVDPIRSPAGCQVYDLFWTNNLRDEWYRAMNRIGIETGLSPASSLILDSTAIGVTGRASNLYRPAPYAYTGTAVDPVAPPGPLTSVHCHTGRHGLVRQTYDHQMSTVVSTGAVMLGASPLWEKLGASDTTTAGLFARFTWTGLIEIVDPA